MIRLPVELSIERKRAALRQRPTPRRRARDAGSGLPAGATRRAVAGAERVQRLIKVYVDLLQREPTTRRTQMTTLAADPGVRAFVSSGGVRGHDWVLAAMRRVASDTARKRRSGAVGHGRSPPLRAR